MNCELFRSTLDDLLDGRLDAAAARSLERHAALCGACAGVRAAERELRAALRQLPAPAPRPHFQGEALRLARLAERNWRRRLRQHDLRLAVVAASVIAGLAAFMVLRHGAVPPDPAVPRLEPQPEVYALTAGQVQALRLRIDAPRDFDGVRFSVELPDQVSLAGQPGIRAMTWEGRLRKGSNVLELPLVAQAGAAGRMATRVSWGEFEQRLEARLVSVPPAAVRRTRPDVEA